MNRALREAREVSPAKSSLPSAVKPALPGKFVGKMDGISISKFVHQLDVYFKLVDLVDDAKRC